MRTKFKIGLWVMLGAIAAFIVFAAAPPPGTYIVPSFFTTNAAKIYGTNGVGVSSNTTLGIYLIDGRSITQGLGSGVSTFSNNVSLTSSTTNYDFYNFLAMTQANGKVSIGTAFNNMNVVGNMNANIVAVTNSVFFWYFNNAVGDFALVSDGNNVTESGVTSTELNYLSGVTDFIQTQLDAKAAKWSFASNNTVLTASPTQVDFYGFTSITQANGKVSVGVPSFTDTDTKGISVQTNAFGGTVGSATNLVIGTTSNVVVTATNTATGNGTNSVWFDTAQPITTKSSPTFENIGITKDASVSNHLAIGAINSATNYFAPFKTRFFALTNASGGWGDWMAGMPNPARRDWFFVTDNGAGVSAIGNQSAASIGSLVNVEAATNEWASFQYSVPATLLVSNGISSQAAATTLSMFPGHNLYYCMVGRVTNVSVNVRVWNGYTSGTTSGMGANTDTPTSFDLAAIRLSSAAAGNLTNWALVTCDATACTVNAGGPASLTTTNVHVFEIMEDRPNTRWLAWVDGICIATNTANLPKSGMKYIYMVSALGTTQNQIKGSVIYGETDNKIDGNIVLSYP